MLHLRHLGDFLCQEHRDGRVDIDFNVKANKKLDSNVHSLLSLSLMDGYPGKYSRKDVERKTIKMILKWLIKQSPRGDLDWVLNGVDFVCRRGILTKMSFGKQLNLNGQNDWCLIAERKNGKIFLEEIEKEEGDSKALQIMKLTDTYRTGVYMGRRFHESYEKHDVKMMIRADIGGKQKNHFKILYSGHVDAIDKEGKHVELKTHKGSLDGYWYLKEKTLKWWLHSVFTGPDYLLVGMKDDRGVVRKIKKTTVESLKNSLWNPEDYLNNLRDTLDYIYFKLPEGENWKFTYTKGELTDEPADVKILSDEFIRHFHLDLELD